MHRIPLTWGREPIEPGRAGPVARAFLVLVSVVAAALSAPPAWDAPPPPLIEADTRQRIQETLDQHLTAIERRDLFLYSARSIGATVYDTELSRIVPERPERAAVRCPSLRAGASPRRRRCTSPERRPTFRSSCTQRGHKPEGPSV